MPTDLAIGVKAAMTTCITHPDGTTITTISK